MNCPQCGAKVTEESTFCAQCGQRLREASGASIKSPFTPAGASGGYEPETQTWEGAYSAKAMIGAWLLALLVTIGAGVAAAMMPEPPVLMGAAAVVVLLWLVLLLVLAYRKLSIRYELSNQRLIHRAGILRQTTDRIELIDIDDVTVVQGLVQRMMGVGTVRITSSDRTHPELLLSGIDDVQRVASKIDDLRREERRKRSVHIESI